MRQLLIVATLTTLTCFAFPLPEAEAGPLMDWWRNRPRLFGRGNVAPPVTAFSPGTASFQTGCTQTCQRVSVNYVPETNYRSLWVQTPVTSYRPSTTADPCTGCQVTCMKPCTTYQWTMRRVPYTTYRPVYQTQTVQMPVANTGSCSTCNVGSTPALGSYGSVPVGGTYPSPAATGYGGTLAPNSYAATPANGTYPGYGGTAAGTPGLGAGTTYPPNGYGAVPPGYQASPTPADTAPTLGGTPSTSSQRVPTVLYDQYGNPVPIPEMPSDRSILERTPINSGDATDANSPNAAEQGNQSGANTESTRSSMRVPTRINSFSNGMSRTAREPIQTPADYPTNNHSPINDPNPNMRRTQPRQAPPISRAADLQAVQLHRPWDYSPVRLASYQSEPARQIQNRRPSTVQSRPAPNHYQPVQQNHRRLHNDGWSSLNR